MQTQAHTRMNEWKKKQNKKRNGKKVSVKTIDDDARRQLLTQNKRTYEKVKHATWIFVQCCVQYITNSLSLALSVFIALRLFGLVLHRGVFGFMFSFLLHILHIQSVSSCRFLFIHFWDELGTCDCECQNGRIALWYKHKHTNTCVFVMTWWVKKDLKWLSELDLFFLYPQLSVCLACRLSLYGREWEKRR